MKVRNTIIYWKHRDDGVTECHAVEDKVITSSAFIKKHFKDIHNRQVALKFSLDKLLKQGHFTKSFRKDAWEAFRTMTKVPRWGKPTSEMSKIYEEAKAQYGGTLEKLAENEAKEKELQTPEQEARTLEAQDPAPIVNENRESHADNTAETKNH